MRRRLTYLLCFLLLLSGSWTAWQWLRPYDSENPLEWQVKEVTLRRDHSYAWLDIVLQHPANQRSSAPPVSRLQNSAGMLKEPADTRLGNDGTTSLIRYWLDWSELSSAWQLQIDGGALRIKDAGDVTLENGQQRIFRQPHW